jgi:serine/threonine protein kinase
LDRLLEQAESLCHRFVNVWTLPADAKIIDLGLAKGIQVEEDSVLALSTQGTFVGIPAYASPEQFAGIGTDIRSDLYSLGITFWEALSGKLPFQGSVRSSAITVSNAGTPVEYMKLG